MDRFFLTFIQNILSSVYVRPYTLPVWTHDICLAWALTYTSNISNSKFPTVSELQKKKCKKYIILCYNQSFYIYKCLRDGMLIYLLI